MFFDLEENISIASSMKRSTRVILAEIEDDDVKDDANDDPVSSFDDNTYGSTAK